jgi:hypothetical protein
MGLSIAIAQANKREEAIDASVSLAKYPKCVDQALWQKSMQLHPKSAWSGKSRPMNEVVTSGDRIVC